MYENAATVALRYTQLLQQQDMLHALRLQQQADVDVQRYCKGDWVYMQ